MAMKKKEPKEKPMKHEKEIRKEKFEKKKGKKHDCPCR